jgi:hypothetical protein
MSQKSEVASIFALFKAQVETLYQTQIKVLRTNGGAEYKLIAKTFPNIIHQIICPYTPQQNGIPKRKHCHMVELSLATLSRTSLPTLY